MSINKQVARSALEDGHAGVGYGLVFRKPASLLVSTYDGGFVRVASTTLGKVFDEYTIQPTTLTVTASKDSYVYINGTTGAVTVAEVANGAAKPSQATIGAKSEWLALITADGTNITGVTDLRRFCGAWCETASQTHSFVTAAQGAVYWTAPANGRLRYMIGTVTSALGASDAGTITAAIGENDTFTNVTNGVLTFALSSAVGVRASAAPSAANNFKQGQQVRFTSAKTTTNGAVEMEFIWERTA